MDSTMSMTDSSDQPRTSSRKRKPSAALLEAAGDTVAAQRMRMSAKSEEAIDELPEERSTSIQYDDQGDISVGGGGEAAAERSPSVPTSTNGGYTHAHNGAAVHQGDLPVNGFSPPKPREAIYQS